MDSLSSRGAIVRILCGFLAAFVLPLQIDAAEVILASNSVWKYFDGGTDQGTAWRATNFNDTTWASGPAKLGYGDGDEATLLTFGPDGNNKYTTYYFRRQIVVPNPAVYTNLTLRVLRDDGAVVYFNSNEVWRLSITNNPVYYTNFASTASEYTYEATNLAPAALVPGLNVISVEVHQGNLTSTDMGFALELLGDRGSANVAPSTTVTNPLNGQSFAAPATINIGASASDSDGTISLVEFYQGTTKIGEDASSPYATSWANVFAGSYQLRSVATDNLGARGTSAVVNITVTGNAAPTANITSPTNNSVFLAPTNVTISASASDIDGNLNRVEFYEGANLLGTDTSSPFSLTWTNPAVGTYTLRAVAVDTGSARGTSAPVAITVASAAPTNLIVKGSIWKYLDNGSDQGTNWRSRIFDDSSWASGPAELGYGDAAPPDNRPEATVVSFGPDPLNKYPTTYFRHTFPVADPNAYVTLTLSLLRDDGAIVYLNGQEVFRSGVRDGTILFSDLTGLQSIPNSDEIRYFTTNPPPSLLVAGANVVAVEVHQATAGSSDISFDLELIGRTNNDRPTVSLTSPNNNATYTAPASISLVASASDSDGTVTNVEFLQNGISIAQDATAPFSVLWTDVPVGTYNITVVATDNLNARSTSSVVTVFVTPAVPPTISNVSPAPGSVSSLSQITVTFSENVTGVSASDLLINGVPATGVSGSNFVYTFTFAQPPDGVVRIAWDAGHGITDFENPPQPFDHYGAGAIWQYNLTDTVAPTMTARSPVPSATVRSLTRISVTFSEAVWGVDAEDLIVNGTSASQVSGSGAGPYTFEFPQPAPGTVTLAWAVGHSIRDFATAANSFAGGSWTYTLQPTATFEGNVVINEIMYHPSSERTDEEYIELFNRGGSAVDLRGWSFSRGVDFTFPATTLAANAYLVIAADPARFAAKYPSVSNVIGPWAGRLSNSGEDIELEDASGDRVDLVEYADEGDFAVRRTLGGSGWEWFAEHDGLGKSLELINAALPNDNGQNWTSSIDLEGTPGRRNSTATNNVAPLILNVSHFPVVPRSTNTVTVSATILDEQTSGLTVTLRYADLTGAGSFVSAAMFDDGAHGDGLANDGVYGASLSAMSVGTIIEFYVQASDAGGRIRTWPAATLSGQDANAFFQVDDEVYSNPEPLFRLIMRPNERDAFFNQFDRVARNATFISIEGSDVEVRYLCDVRRRGASSFSSTPPTMKLNFPRDRTWDGKSSLNLNSVSTWAQVVGSAIALKAGLPATRARGVQLRFNGVDESNAGQQQYGRYAAVEVANDEWAASLFPEDGAGNVYSKRRPLCNLEYRGATAQPYIGCGYDKESNSSENDWSDLVNLFAALDPDTTSDPDYLAAVRRSVNIENWLRHFAVLHLMHYNETALVTGEDDDYDLYRGVVDPRFLLLPHDFDSIFGSEGLNSFGIFQPANIPNVSRFIHHPAIEPLYYEEFRRQLAGVFNTNQLFAIFHEILDGWVPATGPQSLENMQNVAIARINAVLSSLPAAPTVIRATVTGEPATPTYLTNATLTVGGSGITHYRYRLNNAAYSTERTVATPITLTGLSNGTYTIYVIGRDSSGTYQSQSAATVSRTWTVNTALAGVVINEILARNVAAVNRSGAFPDLIELYNSRSSTVDLSGFRLTDDPADPSKFTFPPGSSLAPGAYLVLDADGGSGGTHVGFSLNQDGEGVYLFDRAATGGRLLDAVQFGAQLADISVGRLSNGRWGLTTPSFGSVNVARTTGNIRTLKINEWLADGVFPVADDFVEIYNPDALPIDLGGLYLTDNPVGMPALHRISPLHFVDSFGYRAFIADGDTSAGPDHLGFRLSSERGDIGLFASDLSLIDCITYPQQQAGRSQGRSPNGANNFVFFNLPTPGAGNVVSNSPGGGVVLNEILADNKTIAETDGSRPDWVELYNSSGSPINLADMSLTDTLTDPRRWVFPSNTTIAASGYFKVRLDSDRPSSSTNTGFGLDATGDALYLFQKPASGGGLLDAISFGIQASDFSIGRVPNGSSNWVLTTPTPLGANLAAPLGNANQLRVNEWMASPSSGDDWFELYNPNSQPVVLSGLFLTDDPSTPQSRTNKYQVPPLSFLGVSSYAFQRFEADNNIAAGGNHVGFRLSASLEWIGIYRNASQSIDLITFSNQLPGVSEGRLPDGTTNIVKFPTTATPGDANYLPLTNVVINEVLSHTDLPFEDAIELRNLSGTAVDISGWYLSDKKNDLRKYRIRSSPPTTIPANGYIVFYENQFNPDPLSPTSFALNSSGDNDLYLAQASLAGVFSGYRATASFGATLSAVSCGRYQTSIGIDFPALSRRTFGRDTPDNVQEFRTGTGTNNAYPLVGPVVISEIMYHPPNNPDGSDNVLYEFVELQNITPAPVPMYHTNFTTNTWRLRGGADFNFPTNFTLAANGIVLLVSFDPSNDPGSLLAFRTQYSLSTAVTILGPYLGKLNNGGESLELRQPDAPETTGPDAGKVPYVVVDRVVYADTPPWYYGADGFGDSLQRINLDEYGNDPVNWRSAAPTPGPSAADTDGDGMPDAWEDLYNLNKNSAADASGDPDGDGLTNLREYLAGTSPRDPSSNLRLQIIALSPVTLRFFSVSNRTYTIEYQNVLNPGPWNRLTNLPAQVTTGLRQTTDATVNAMRFYRIRTPQSP